jgi:hypothetical protein
MTQRPGADSGVLADELTGSEGEGSLRMRC